MVASKKTPKKARRKSGGGKVVKPDVTVAMDETWTAGGYHILPVIVKQSGVEDEGVVRLVYFKEHRAGGDGEGRTLFVTNAPPGASVDDVAQIFSEAFGEVRSVTLGVMRGVGAAAKATALGKRKKRETKKTVLKPDFNLNTNVGLSFAEDDTVKYQRINAVGTAAAGEKKAKGAGSDFDKPAGGMKGPGKEATILGEKSSASTVRFLAGSFMHLVFEEKESLQKALECTREELDELDLTCELITGSQRVSDDSDNEEGDASGTPALVGFGHWLHCHHDATVDREKLLREVDEVMVEFDRQKREEERQERETFDEVDEDGFIMVRPRKRRHTDGRDTQVQGVRASAINIEDGRKKKDKVLTDFYRFQRHEKQRDRLADLRKKFDEDKQRIATMKANRRFKPF